MVGDSVFEFAKSFYDIGVLPQGVNDTLLVLMPKVQPPELVTHLRPISLCNVSYKIITKAITNRLKRIIPSFIGPNQSSFVPER